LALKLEGFSPCCCYWL